MKFFTAFPQLVSRIGHPNKDVSSILVKIIAKVLQKYPQQALWPMVGVMQSRRTDRKTVCAAVLHRAQVSSPKH